MSSVENPTKPESLKDEVHKAFTAYSKHAAAILKQPASLKVKMVAGSLKLAYIDPSLRLRLLVDQAEKSSELRKLSSIVEQTFHPYSSSNPSTGIPVVFMEPTYLCNFLRRSHFYSQIFRDAHVSIDDLFDLLWSSFFLRSVKTMKFSLLDGVSFSSARIKFDLFEIRKFSKKQLDALIDCETNRVFYPEAQLDTKFVSQYWFLVEESRADHGYREEQSNHQKSPAEVGKKVKKEIPAPLWPPVERKLPDGTLQLLSLHEWTPDWMRDEDQMWTGFTVPFSFQTNDDPFDEPYSIANLPRLEQIEVVLGIREGPFFMMEVEKQKEIQLQRVVEKGKIFLEILDKVGSDWHFVEIAMGYLAKAFLTDNSLDQLLWHMAVLEALLGDEDSDGVMKTIRRRIGNILGSTESEKNQVRKSFNKLYGFRSDLVHGNSYTKKAELHHLADARELARRVLLWFLDYLTWIDEEFQQRGRSYEYYPRRAELLSALDIDQASLNLIREFPPGFPRLTK